MTANSRIAFAALALGVALTGISASEADARTFPRGTMVHRFYTPDFSPNFRPYWHPVWGNGALVTRNGVRTFVQGATPQCFWRARFNRAGHYAGMGTACRLVR